MPVITSATIVPGVNEHYDRTTLMRALENLCHNIASTEKFIPLGSGRTYKVRRYESQAALTTPLTEGVTPASLTPSVTDLTCSVAQYGGFYEGSDVVDWTNTDAILTELSEVLGECAGRTADTIYRNVAAAGSSVRYASGVANRAAVVNKITALDLELVQRALMSNNARPLKSVVKASTQVGTLPIGESYIAIVHPHVWFNILRDITGIIRVEEYGSGSDKVPGEVGAYQNIRFVQSSNARVWADSGAAVGGLASGVSTTGVLLDVYGTVIFGKDAFITVSLKGKALENIRKPLGSAGAADPLNQKWTIGFKEMIGAMITNESNMYRIESACTTA